MKITCLRRKTFLHAGLLAIAGCSIQLVAPYNPDLAQRASNMQAEIAAFDLTMLKNAGTTDADPDNATVSGTLNKWRGEQEAMLTLAISSDPHSVPCAKAAAAIRATVGHLIPQDLQATEAQSPATDELASTSGCETTLVAEISGELDRLQQRLAYCKVPPSPDAGAATPLHRRKSATPPVSAQLSVKDTCSALFDPSPGVPRNAAEYGHGPGVSVLLETLQAITYIESRKRALATAKVGM